MRVCRQAFDQIEINQQQMPVKHRGFLAAEEQFTRPQDQSILASVQRVAQDQMHQLRQKDRRHGDGVLLDDCQIAGLDRAMGQQQVTEADQEMPVLAGIGSVHALDVDRSDHAARIGQQGLMQGLFVGTGVIRRHHFGPRQQAQQQFIGHIQRTLRIATGQMVAA